MAHALALAERGTALASPNPLVGAVLVRDGKIVGEAFHTYDGRQHAEVLVIEQAGDAARGATLYINLEPCCHQGRTGPCTEAILAAGIKKVVAAMADPNPQVSGKGFEILRQGGLDVVVGVCEEQARRLNESFARYIRTGLPLVTLKTAMTLDGKIAAPDDSSDPPRPPRAESRGAEPRGWVTSEAARAHVQRQRHASNAILTSIGTILADDPLLTDRCGLPRRRPLLRVIMDSRLRIPLTARLLGEVNNDLLIFTLPSADPDKRLELERRGVQVCALPGEARPDLRKALEELGQREITSVLLEAGAELNGAALDAGLVDKVFLYYAPKILGGRDSLPMATGRGVRAMRDALPVHGIRRYDFGPDFAVEGYLRNVYGDPCGAVFGGTTASFLSPPVRNRTVEFFDTQFQRQVVAADYALNPFERAILPFVFGDVLDLGCGLGNLAVEAATKGCRVAAFDASPTAIADLTRRVQERGLPITAREADLRHLAVEGQFDTVIAIGLFMFFAKEAAREGLARVKELTKPGGIAAVNVLLEGTTYLGMFEPGEYYLFSENELVECFAGWTPEYLKYESFAAPNDTVKRFCTLVARRPVR